MKKQQSGFGAIEIIIVLAVVGVIGVVGWMVFGRSKKSDTSKNTDTTTVTQPVATESGSCFGVSKDTIKSILGAPAAGLQDLSDTGVQDIGEGDKAQTCVYTFAPGADVTNSFTIDLGTYASQANLDASQKYIPNNGGVVEGLGDSATYEAKDAALSKSRDFVLTVRQGLKLYKFGISQPQDALTYNDASAQRALIQIAQAATL
jgi:hypothetical protein